MTSKRNVVLYLDSELVEETRDLGFNLSRTFENHMKTLITRLSTLNQSNKDFKREWWAGPDLNQRASARQADVLTNLDHRP